MNILMKGFIYFFFLIYFVFSCSNSKNMNGIDQDNKNQKNVEFIEVRRLNHAIELNETSLINSTNEIKLLYQQLNDSRYSKSAPIPVLEGDEEAFLVLKPKLKRIKYGDIEVEILMLEGSTLWVTYKEVENPEYFEKKQSDPIVILKIFNSPKTVRLIQTQ